MVKFNNFDEKPIGQVNVLMLQPALDPYAEKYSKDSATIVKELLVLAEENTKGKIDYYIAPETAIPGRNQKGAMADFDQLQPNGQIRW